MDRRSGLNLLQADKDFRIVLKVLPFLGNLVKEMNSETTGHDANVFFRKSAVDVFFSFANKSRGHADSEKLYQAICAKVDSFTKLHWCSCTNDAEEAVELVVNDGVDVNIPASFNRTPLLLASISSSSLLIQTLIDLGADMNAQSTDGNVAPLKLAADWNNYMATRMLLEHGADPNIQDIRGDTPLHSSIQEGFFKISQLLIEAGCNINLRNKQGRTPLFLAVKKHDEKLVQLLLECNADVNMECKQDRVYLVQAKEKGRSAWHYVVVEKYLVGLFLKRSFRGGFNVADFGILLESGWGKNPPENTLEKVNKKADALFTEISSETLLHVASRNNDCEIIELLVKNGSSDVNSRDSEGYTPLHIAAIHGNMYAVRKLLDLRADISRATTDGRVAADLAHLNKETEIEEHLKRKICSSQ